MLPEQCKEDLFRCISYWFVAPTVLALGLVGSFATLMIMVGPTFRTSTFFYLRILSISDMMYLISASGLMVEFFLIDAYTNLSLAATYYLTHFDHILCNTFISTSGFIIIILTLDRYRCICQPTLPRDNNPGVYCGLAILISFAWQVPRFFTKVIVSECVHIQPNVTSADLYDSCECDLEIPPECHYRRKIITKDHIFQTFPWVVYVVLAELFVKVIPSFLLVSLNALMINRFHKVIERRSILRAKTFVEGSTRLSLIADITDIQESNLADKVISRRVSILEVAKEDTKIDEKSVNQTTNDLIYQKASGFRLNTENILKKPKTSKTEQSKTYLVSKKDKSLIKLLFVLSLVFFVANIPMAIGRTLGAFGYSSNDHFAMKVFFTICNILEFFFAASNFYLYCFCNAKIRKKVCSHSFSNQIRVS